MTSATYKTKNGEQWDEIAKKVYGNELHADFLMMNNPEKIAVFAFKYGDILKTPEIPESASDLLPPWRKQ